MLSLDLECVSVTTATCLLLLLAIYLSSKFGAFEFCYCFLSIYACIDSFKDRVELLHEASSLGQPIWFILQKRASAANEAAPLILCWSNFNRAYFYYRISFKMMESSILSHKWASSLRVITPLEIIIVI